MIEGFKGFQGFQEDERAETFIVSSLIFRSRLCKLDNDLAGRHVLIIQRDSHTNHELLSCCSSVRSQVALSCERNSRNIRPTRSLLSSVLFLLLLRCQVALHLLLVRIYHHGNHLYLTKFVPSQLQDMLALLSVRPHEKLPEHPDLAWSGKNQ